MTRFWLACALALAAPLAAAATCSVTATTLAFGTYNPLNGSATDSTSTITVSCTKGAASTETVNYTIALSTGSGTYTNRTMSSGAQTLNYNLYTATARTTVWGNGTSPTATIAASFSLTTASPTQNRAHTVYGRMAAAQNAAAGSYSTTTPVTVTVTY
jgi:spore coat protein U-like protein